jgi:hypothetical protein
VTVLRRGVVGGAAAVDDARGGGAAEGEAAADDGAVVDLGDVDDGRGRAGDPVAAEAGDAEGEALAVDGALDEAVVGGRSGCRGAAGGEREEREEPGATGHGSLLPISVGGAQVSHRTRRGSSPARNAAAAFAE